MPLLQNKVEDEAHLLIDCPQYKELRDKLLPPRILNNPGLNSEQKLVKILSDKDSLKSTAKFIYQAFEDRKIGLDVLNTIEDLVQSTEKIHTANSLSSSTKNGSYTIKSSSDDGMKITLAKIL